MGNKAGPVIAILDKSCGTGEGQTYNQRRDTEMIKTRWAHYNLGVDTAHVFCHDNKRSAAEKAGGERGIGREEERE